MTVRQGVGPASSHVLSSRGVGHTDAKLNISEGLHDMLSWTVSGLAGARDRLHELLQIVQSRSGSQVRTLSRSCTAHCSVTCMSAGWLDSVLC